MQANKSTQHDQMVPPALEPALEREELLAVAARLEAESATAVASLRRQAALLHARIQAAGTTRRAPEKR
ncbi:hypothetical protein OG216_00790 [Streptomycetaceae bacterium NBC_01309]